ncbi:hypothetical protein [Amycolatopsis sp. VC5-11]|uniref:hypothetical protein n=1 Tax=Amycolatopsis sp. VC5-11 TaxID=3120156 RepID=UPI0030084FA0
MSRWDRDRLNDLLRRIEQAGPLDRDPAKPGTEALEDRLAWLERAWPGTTRAQRLAPALDDLSPDQRDQLAAELLGDLDGPEDHENDWEN